MRYIRSDFPDNLSDREMEWLIENDVTTIVDLREEKEYLIKPCSLEEDDRFAYYHMPVTAPGW